MSTWSPFTVEVTGREREDTDDGGKDREQERGNQCLGTTFSGMACCSEKHLLFTYLFQYKSTGGYERLGSDETNLSH